MATFTQQIDGVAHIVTIPDNRVETIIDRCDRLLETNNFKKAYEVIQPFLGQAAEVTPVVKTTIGNKGQAAADLIAANSDKVRGELIKILCDALNITYANAFYYVKKAGK